MSERVIPRPVINDTHSCFGIRVSPSMAISDLAIRDFVFSCHSSFALASTHARIPPPQVLFNKNLYQIAISLARSQGSDEAAVMEIYQMFGDHLYKKGDYDAAITQYIETIHFVEPSYVIRNFLDAQRIHNLTRYLQVCARPLRKCMK